MRRANLFVLFALLADAASLRAQTVSVQQPVVGTVGVGTTVSVPDRGSLLLGGANSAAAARSTSGFPRTSSSLGLQTQGSSLSAHVFIHNLRAMDDALLAAAQPAEADPWSRRLSERRGTASAPADFVAPPPSRAAEFEARAARAEQNGKPAVALTYWRLAAKDGSATAVEKLRSARTEISRPDVRAARRP